jgi:hypothetical protein
MIRSEARRQANLVVGLITGVGLLAFAPFPAGQWLFQILRDQKPDVFYLLAGLYNLFLFTTPCWLASALLSILGRVTGSRREEMGPILLPPWPDQRQELCIVVGERHGRRAPNPVENPDWLIIGERGLFTGIAIIGAIGSGKTSCCMQPFAEQILGFQAHDAEKRIGGLVLEVKGDFCHRIRSILEHHGRGEDYVEINLTDSPFRYNPLANDLDPYALAFGIATLLTSLFGRGREPFWQQAYTNMNKFLILLHRLLYGYVTLLDIYECAIDPDLLKKRIGLLESAVADHRIAIVDPAVYLSAEGLADFPWERNAATSEMETLLTDELAAYLLAHSILHKTRKLEVLPSGIKLIRDSGQRDQVEAVRRWFYHDWMRIEQRLRTSIVEGISFFLSLFDDNPALKKVFCPPKECFDPNANRDGKFGKPLPPFSELIEQGKVVALNFPMSGNPGLARLIGTLMKVDFQRAVLDRVPRMEASPDAKQRQVLFLCDEYHAFATVGESDPTGDEKFFALSRQAKCIAIVATQSISSLRSTLSGEAWRTLLQTFRTKIFLSLSDDFSAKVASELSGRDEQLKPSYNFSENGQDAHVSIMTGRATAQRASITASKNYNLQRDNIFEPRIFAELKNAQAIVLAYDGLNPLPATYCYLKPYYLDLTVSYFEHLRRGLL